METGLFHDYVGTFFMKGEKILFSHGGEHSKINMGRVR